MMEWVYFLFFCFPFSCYALLLAVGPLFSYCYKWIRHKEDQSQRRHRFNVENPSKAKGKKTTGAGQQQSHYFRVVTNRRKFTKWDDYLLRRASASLANLAAFFRIWITNLTPIDEYKRMGCILCSLSSLHNIPMIFLALMCTFWASYFGAWFMPVVIYWTYVHAALHKIPYLQRMQCISVWPSQVWCSAVATPRWSDGLHIQKKLQNSTSLADPYRTMLPGATALRSY
jgi:hypothetical protein